MAYDVFISYRWVEPDQSWVRQALVPALKRAGLAVCLDVEDFVPGRDLICEMTRAGSESRKALSIISPDYFDGNRMVNFESLMVRRFDPAGAESRLIPLIFRATKMPEWMRGLIPVDWTKPENCSREWLKLLKVLGASNTSVPAPSAVPQGRAVSAASPIYNEKPTARRHRTEILWAEFEHPHESKVLIVTGTPGTGTASLVAEALTASPCALYSVSLNEIVREPLWGQSSQEVALLRCLANALGAPGCPTFEGIWTRYERCFTVASRIRTMVDQSGYASVRQSLQSLVHGEGRVRRDTDTMAILKRVLAADDDIDLVLRPHRRLLAALLLDLAALTSCTTVFHFCGIESATEAPFALLLSALAEFAIQSPQVRIVVSLEARPNSYTLLKQFRIIHIPAASTSEIMEYLRDGTPEGGRHRVDLDSLLARLSSGSFSVAEFLRHRPRLTIELAALDNSRDEDSLLTAAEGWCLLASAYDVTPTLISQCFGIAESQARLIADEIPDELDGGRRLPVNIAAAVISASAPSTIYKVNQMIESHFRQAISTNEERWVSPTHARIGLAFHIAWNSGALSMIDGCLLQNFRQALGFCSNLHRALNRLLTIAPLPQHIALNVSQRIQIIERIDAGQADNEAVMNFFERIAEGTTDFDRSQRAVAYYQLGHSYFSCGQDDLAAVSLEYAVELDSTYFNAWSLLGVVLDLKGQKREPILALREAIKRNGRYEFAHFNLGTIYERRGQLIDAAHSYIAAMKCEPSFYEAAYNLSNTLLELHLVRDAVQIATFTGAIAHELRVEPIFNIANAMASLGDLAGAIKLFRYCLDERPDSRFAYNLALGYAANDQPESAMRLLKEAETLAIEDGNEKIGRLAAQIRTEVRAGKPINWPDHLPTSKVTRDQAALLRTDLEELSLFLKRHGLGKGAEGIRRTIAKMSTRGRAIDKVRGKIVAAQVVQYARLPSYGGG